MIEGDFLILGPTGVEEPGFLKTEFVEHLEKLPAWTKTRYYCQSHAAHLCSTGGPIEITSTLERKPIEIERASIVVCAEPIAESTKVGNLRPDVRDVFLKLKSKYKEIRKLFKLG